ncbi:MAG: type I glutamate--ammonia ligase [Geminicoccaceae bacterium]
MPEIDRILSTIADQGIRTVDFRFTDLAGRWRHVSLDAGDLDAGVLREGLMIDGSAVPGWREVTDADLLLKPDPAATHLDPFAAQPTLAIICDATEPGSGIGYERDPRAALGRAEAWLARSRHADRARVGVELDFHLFDEIRLDSGPGRSGFAIAGAEREPVGGSSFLAMPPADRTADIRAEMASVLRSLGVPLLRHGHGTAPGLNRLGFGPGSPTATADRIQLARYAATQVAASYGKSVTFLPKPFADQGGAGLNLHVSLWQGERPAFAGTGYADLSPACLHFIAGVMTHAKALNAFTNPTTNSYRRLRRGLDAPALLAYAAHNRSAAIRIPYAAQPAGKRVEIRFPDPTANPYLALAAIIMAGLDGIERKLEPGDAMDRNLYDLPLAETEDIRRVAGSLGEALDALEQDHEFLTRGEAIPPDLIDAFVRVKRAELERVERAPHPVEMQLWGLG